MPAYLDELNKSIELFQLYFDRFNIIYSIVKSVLDNQLAELDKLEDYPITPDLKVNELLTDIFYHVNHLKFDLEGIIYLLDGSPNKKE